MRLSFFISFLLLLGVNSFAQKTNSIFDAPLTNIDNRSSLSLNGKWHYIMDPYETGYYNYRHDAYDASDKLKNNRAAYYNHAKAKDKFDRVEYDFDNSPTLLVPGDWNSQEEKLLYYEGTIWYKKSFPYTKKKNTRQFLHFGAVNYIAEVYLNGQKLGVHEGGFTPFYFEITDILKEKDNFVVVKVDNTRFKEAVPTTNTDWWNYGGITRDVQIVEVPHNYIQDYTLQLNPKNKKEINGFVQIAPKYFSKQKASLPPATKVTISIPELKIAKTVSVAYNFNGPNQSAFKLKSRKIQYWSPESPKLYEVLFIMGKDTLKDQIGFRTIESKNAQILLNGKSVFLRGICMHEENTVRGRRAFSEEDAIVALHQAKELNCNFMRLAHYPHNENIIRLADKLGMLIWEETPVYWTIDFTNKKVLAKAKKQLQEVILRDKNRASVVIWSVSNETPQGEARNIFLTDLINTVRKADDTRLVSAALQHVSKNGFNIIDDPMANIVDIIAFNQYIGWYGGRPVNIPKEKWAFDQGKPVIVSEFGAGALGGYYADRDTRWTEEYQEYLYAQTIKMLKKMPNLAGISPWILADFRSPKRNLPKIQDGWNRKGLISNTGNRKKAFYVLQRYYQEIKNQK